MSFEPRHSIRRELGLGIKRGGCREDRFVVNGRNRFQIGRSGAADFDVGVHKDHRCCERIALKSLAVSLRKMNSVVAAVAKRAAMQPLLEATISGILAITAQSLWPSGRHTQRDGESR